MKKSGIYVLVNLVDGKKYVGQTTNLIKRKSDHFTALRGGYNKNQHLQSAYRKYGERNFEWRILEECDCAMLDTRERAWISYYDSIDGRYGYNNESGGNTKKSVSVESRAKMSASLMGTQRAKGHAVSKAVRLILAEKQRGKKHSEETKQKMSLSRIGKKMPPCSDETRRKMSKALKGKSAWNKGLKVSDKTRLRISESKQNLSQETRTKMSMAKAGKTWTQARRDACRKAERDVISAVG